MRAQKEARVQKRKSQRETVERVGTQFPLPLSPSFSLLFYAQDFISLDQNNNLSSQHAISRFALFRILAEITQPKE